jgi:hypothetical protein
MTVAKRPSWITIAVACWCGLMFATAVAAVIPSLRLLAAPILCHTPYSHGVVEQHNYSYGATSGYSLSLRCANAQHQEHGTNGIAVIGLLWLYGWIAALLIRGVYYWTKVLIVKRREAAKRWRIANLPDHRPNSAAATPASLLGSSPGSRPKPATPTPHTFAQRARASQGLAVAVKRGRALDQLMRLADLHDRGVLSDQEFAAEKAKIMSLE